ncbi:GATA transcription factor 4-like [Phragmites australis]|uniref:GATA transcription factor 4-like n=1 Tax=Phragmites australis TaxID=29695 RepID=UPI002D77F7B2|nr:GATA transcription factor 4-like [Phragmites australis]
MAPEWEAAAMGIDPGMGSIRHNSMAAAAPMSFSSHASAAAHHFYGADQQLPDLSNAGAAHDFFHAASAGSSEPSAAATPDQHGSLNLSFTDELYLPVPSEEAAELEWLSNFVDDSYPDIPNYPPEVQAEIAAAAGKNNNPGAGGSGSGGGEEACGVRRCTHCASEKTPQWRTGPLGPKTLCNACGVRYKSGRLVPEYRPAASPTFVLTQHSNSHRKVMELRRQKELLVLRGNAAAASGSGGAELMFRDYGVC